METALEILRKYYKQRDLAARDWKERGGKVIGYFCDSVPEELIMAAGFFPFRLTGDPQDNSSEIDKYLPYSIWYEGFVRSQLNMLLSGQFDFLDFLVIPRSRDTIAMQYSHLCEIRDYVPNVKLPVLYSFEFTHTRTYKSQFYTRDRVRDFKSTLEEWSGKGISNRLLSEAIATTNENKKLLKQIAELRATESPKVSGVEALQIIGSSMFMLKEEHNRLLELFLKEVNNRPARDGVRLFIESSPLDNLQFYELVESCQACIVAEDHCWGNRYSDNPIDVSLDPLEAIAYRYHFKTPCPYIYWPTNLRTEYSLKKAVEAKAQGIIFYIYEYDAGQVWDYPEQNKAFKGQGIPTLALTEQKYQISEPDKLKKSIENFIQSIN